MSNLDVSVVVGAYNAMPYVRKCVTSVLEQSIGLDRLELICVDDGSTDGTGEELDRFAADCPSMRVVHQANSGSPAGPRNVGIGMAQGQFLFFLDADDYLGPEALARMVAAADRNGSDVVLGRPVGVGGRGAPKSMFRQSQERADLFTSRVWWTLSAEKLYRKALIDRLGLRFPDIGIGQDQPFGGMAYLHARAISVVADYDCVYIVQRDDGQNNTKKHSDPRVRLRSIEIMMQMVADHVEPGKQRDLLMERHIRYDLRVCFGNRYLKASEPSRKEVVDRARELVEAYWTPWLAERAPIGVRLRCELIRRGELDRLAELIRFDLAGERGKDLVRDGRVYAAYPYFGDPAVGIPDDCYDVTNKLTVHHWLDAVEWEDGALALRGHAFIGHVDVTDPAIRVVLRERASGMAHELPATLTATPELTESHGEGRYTYDRAGFTVRVDPATAAAGAPLPRGLWDVHVSVHQQGVHREARLGSSRHESIPGQVAHAVRHGSGGPLAVASYFTQPGDNLTLDVGPTKHAWKSKARVDRVAWSRLGTPTALVLAGHGAEGTAAVRVSRPDGASYRVSAQTGAGGWFAASVPFGSAADGRPLSNGRWRVGVEDVIGDTAGEVPELPRPARVRLWWRRWQPVLVVTSRNPGDLQFEVVPLLSGTTFRRAGRRVAKAVTRRR